MGGEIGLKSQINEGSTFWFTLPYVPATNQHHEEETKSEPIKIKKQKITILVAEDHESNYHLIESILKKTTLWCMPGMERKRLIYSKNMLHNSF